MQLQLLCNRAHTISNVLSDESGWAFIRRHAGRRVAVGRRFGPGRNGARARGPSSSLAKPFRTRVAPPFCCHVSQDSDSARSSPVQANPMYMHIYPVLSSTGMCSLVLSAVTACRCQQTFATVRHLCRHWPLCAWRNPSTGTGKPWMLLTMQLTMDAAPVKGWDNQREAERSRHIGRYLCIICTIYCIPFAYHTVSHSGRSLSKNSSLWSHPMGSKVPLSCC